MNPYFYKPKVGDRVWRIYWNIPTEKPVVVEAEVISYRRPWYTCRFAGGRIRPTVRKLKGADGLHKTRNDAIRSMMFQWCKSVVRSDIKLYREQAFDRIVSLSKLLR